MSEYGEDPARIDIDFFDVTRDLDRNPAGTDQVICFRDAADALYGHIAEAYAKTPNAARIRPHRLQRQCVAAFGELASIDPEDGRDETIMALWQQDDTRRTELFSRLAPSGDFAKPPIDRNLLFGIYTVASNPANKWNFETVLREMYADLLQSDLSALWGALPNRAHSSDQTSLERFTHAARSAGSKILPLIAGSALGVGATILHHKRKG